MSVGVGGIATDRYVSMSVDRSRLPPPRKEGATNQRHVIPRWSSERADYESCPTRTVSKLRR
jgi:hypothetical protein